MKLKDELGYRKGFDVLAHEALLNIYHTASGIKKRARVFFEEAGLTDAQFNLLMTLHYQGGEGGGLTQADLGRMLLVNRANISALLDRMEKTGLVRRDPGRSDRRVHIARVTPRGLALLVRIEAAYMNEVFSVMGGLSDAQLQEMLRCLERIRDNIRAVPSPSLRGGRDSRRTVPQQRVTRS